MVSVRGHLYGALENIVSGTKQCCDPSPLPAELLVPYPAEEMTAWRVAGDAKNSRIEPHPEMAGPVLAEH